MPQGAIDTADIANVEIRVEGAEVGAYVEHRGFAYSDGSAKAIFAQFRANPATETTGVLCYSGCTVDSTRITEQSWVTHDTTIANIESGPDSVGYYHDQRGYHPVMAFATDSAWLSDALGEFIPLATIEEVNALTGILATVGDTVPERFRVYRDLVWDSTVDARIAGEANRDVAFADVIINVNGATTYGGNCEDWTSTATNYLLFRKAIGQSDNKDCRGGWTYYDPSAQMAQYAAMRHGDSISVEFFRRSFALSFSDLMYYPPQDNGAVFQCNGSTYRRGVAVGHLYSYWLTGDSAYVDQVGCIAGLLTRSTPLTSFGDENSEARPIGFTLDAASAAYFVNDDVRNWSAYIDSLVVWAVNGRGVYGGTPAYGGGIWALDSATAVCSNSPGATRPSNTLMIPMAVHGLRTASRVVAKDTFVVGTDSTMLPEVFAAVADTVTYRTGLWVDSVRGFHQHDQGQPCDSPDSWGTVRLSVNGMFSIIPYAAYSYDNTAARLAHSDTMLQKITVDTIATVSYPNFSFTGDGSDHRPFIISEWFMRMWASLGWRQCTLQGDC
jgi:hypothetical protein